MVEGVVIEIELSIRALPHISNDTTSNAGL